MSDQIALTIRLDGHAASRRMIARSGTDTPAGAFWNSTLWFNLWHDAEQVMLLFKDNPEVLKALAGERMLAGFSLLENDGMHAVYAANWRHEPIEALLKVKGNDIRYRTAQFNGEQVFTIEMKNGEYIVLAHCANLLLFSRYSYLVEDAIDQIQHGASWWNNRKFASISPSQHRFYVAIRPDKFMENLSSGSKTGTGKDGESMDMGLLIRWIGCSWDGEKTDGVVVPGLLSPFNREGNPDAMSVMLPDDPSALIWAHLQEKPWWLYGSHQHVYQQYIQPWVGTELACVISESYGPELCWVFAVKDKAAASRALDRYGEKYGLLKKYDYQTYTILHFFRPDIVGVAAKSRIGDLRNPACAILGNFVVFAPSTAILETWIDKLIVSQTLANHPDWLLLRKSLPDNMQALIALNGARAPGLFGAVLPEETLRNRAEEIRLVTQTGFLAIPIWDGHRSPWHFQIWAKPRTSAQPVSTIVWKTSLSAKAIGRPCIFDRRDGGKHILIQDTANLLYCLDEHGRILWRRQLEEPVLSEIHSIDYLRNARNHFLFNTAGRIMLLDDQGRDVSGFPLNLLSPATNGLLAVDFNQDQQFCFFIACQNRNVYGFDQFGRPLSGWNPQSGIGTVQLPLRHLQTGNSDLILAQNTQGRLFAFGRHGEKKFGPVQMEGTFSQAPQIDPEGRRIVCADIRGKIYVFNPQGQFFTIHAGIPADEAAVQTVFQQISGDKRSDFAFFSRKSLQIAGYQGNQFRRLFQTSFEEAQDTLFGVPGFGIGTLQRSRNKITLIGADGLPVSGFPLAGDTPFSVSGMNAESALLVTGFEHYAYAYKISH